MKQFFIFCLSLLICATNFAQNSKTYEQTQKELERELRSNPVRDARKQAKVYAKQGYLVPPGELPLERQLDMSYKLKIERDDRNGLKYIFGSAQAIGTNYSAAKNQAINLAKLNLAGNIESQIASLADISVANNDLSQGEAASVVKTAEAAKGRIAQEFGRLISVLEIYRTLDNKNVEVRVELAYSQESANQVIRKVLVKELEDKTGILHDKLDKMLNLQGSKN